MNFFIQFLDVSGEADHFKRHFFYPYEIIILMEWPNPPPLFGKFLKNYYFFFKPSLTYCNRYLLWLLLYAVLLIFKDDLSKLTH